jgi:heme-degrading monooxygenase HmoA
MAIKVFIKRKFKDLDYREISSMIISSRTLAMDQRGYIGSETLWSQDDEKTVMVVSIWQNAEFWKNYLNSPARKKLEDDFQQFLAEPVKYEKYHLGTFSDIET